MASLNIKQLMLSNRLIRQIYRHHVVQRSPHPVAQEAWNEDLNYTRSQMQPVSYKPIQQSKRIIALSIGLSLFLWGCSTIPQNEQTPPASDSNSAPQSTELDTELDTLSADVSNPTQGQMLPITAEASVRGHIILLEIAQTPRQQAIGLMFREDLPDNQGMLFPFNPPRPVHFWMRNVQFPLDMIFLRNSEVKAIAPSVPPCTTAACPTYGPDDDIDQVLELKGGRAEALGISVGDIIDINYLDEESVPSPVTTP